MSIECQLGGYQQAFISLARIHDRRSPKYYLYQHLQRRQRTETLVDTEPSVCLTITTRSSFFVIGHLGYQLWLAVLSLDPCYSDSQQDVSQTCIRRSILAGELSLCQQSYLWKI
jgi:hypothetical protein